MPAALEKYAPVILVIALLLGYQWHQQSRTNHYQALAYLSEGLAVAAPVKVQVVIYYQEYGSLPSSNGDLGLPAPNRFKRQSLQSLAISKGGIITLTYDRKSGVQQGVVELIPVVDGRGRIQWECFTPNYPDLNSCGFIVGV